MNPQPMSRRDASDLAAHVRREAHNAKALASVRTAEVLADFEKQMATEYSFDQDAVWKKAAAEADTVVREAREKIAQRCRELGIPARFAPSLGGISWYNRGENMVNERRAELRRVAETRLAAMEKAAKVQIETKSLEMQKVLLSGVLTTSEAQAFLAQIPTASDLMPVLALGEIAKQLGPGRNYYGVEPDDDDVEPDDDAEPDHDDAP